MGGLAGCRACGRHRPPPPLEPPLAAPGRGVARRRAAQAGADGTEGSSGVHLKCKLCVAGGLRVGAAAVLGIRCPRRDAADAAAAGHTRRPQVMWPKAAGGRRGRPPGQACWPGCRAAARAALASASPSFRTSRSARLSARAYEGCAMAGLRWARRSECTGGARVVGGGSRPEAWHPAGSHSVIGGRRRATSKSSPDVSCGRFPAAHRCAQLLTVAMHSA